MYIFNTVTLYLYLPYLELAFEKNTNLKISFKIVANCSYVQ